MSVEWGSAVKEYKHEFVILLGLLIILKIFLAATGQMPFWSLSFVQRNDANTALNAGAQAASDLQQIY